MFSLVARSSATTTTTTVHTTWSDASKPRWHASKKRRGLLRYESVLIGCFIKWHFKNSRRSTFKTFHSKLKREANWMSMSWFCSHRQSSNASTVRRSRRRKATRTLALWAWSCARFVLTSYYAKHVKISSINLCYFLKVVKEYSFLDYIMGVVKSTSRWVGFVRKNIMRHP